MRNPIKYLWEMFSDWADISPWLPWTIKSKVYFVNDYFMWRKEPRGVRSTIMEPQSSFIVKRHYDREGFDADGIGDYFYTTYEYEEYSSEQEILMDFKKNIRLEAGLPPKLKTVQEYCQEFGFEVYERKY